MIHVHSLEQTGNFCPSQWEGRDDEGRQVYIRYRHGRLTAQLDGRLVYEGTHGDEWDGTMKTETMLYAVASLLEMAPGEVCTVAKGADHD